MQYKLLVAKVYGKDTLYKPETTITQGETYSLNEVCQQLNLIRKYTKCLRYKFVVALKE